MAYGYLLFGIRRSRHLLVTRPGNRHLAATRLAAALKPGPTRVWAPGLGRLDSEVEPADHLLPAHLQEVEIMDTGDTAWVLATAALVLLMTPGLALFYGGMVRAKSVLNMMMMSFGALALISVLWVLYGYSVAFGNDVGGGLVGNPFEFFGLQGPDGRRRGSPSTAWRHRSRAWPSSPSRPCSRSSPSR